MTSSEIRQSFLDFFKSKQHTIVPSSSLLPDSPNLLFTNAGMNQFVPIFLGQVKCPYNPPRAADTQKCIRAGGKHNDLDDVGLDTYHHTFFEMLGNWSFGDYFKKEAIDWAWELITEVWKFPKNRLYATVYCPHMDAELWRRECSYTFNAVDNGAVVVNATDYLHEFHNSMLKGLDQVNKKENSDYEAIQYWYTHFKAAGLDPHTHIVPGNKKDNFWMMGETGPCGPCSELHVDLTPKGDTGGKLVNKGSPECIEIWNLVFIQFNANPDGTFSPLPARHVDTGMGFERATSIIQCTKNFTDFTGIISNYETDIFRPIFDKLEKMSGKKYGSTLPVSPAPVSGEPLSASLPGEHTRPRVLPTAPSRSASETSGVSETNYSRRNLPHFERPWAKYMVTFSTVQRRELTPAERDLVMQSILYAHEHHQYQLYAASVMPDHVHLLFEPQIKELDKEGNPVFWPLSEILQGIKSASAHQINKASGQKGVLWEKESVDRMIRGQADMEEKFHYICRNPWEAGIVVATENYPWLWTPEVGASAGGAGVEGGRRMPTAGAQSATREGACAPRDGEQEKIDVAFRVIADHIRTLSFAIADGIQPGNTDRNYVLRRILRRAVRYGRILGFHEPFFYKLVDVLEEKMGDVFPEIRARGQHVQEVIQHEEEAFNKTLDRGIEIFENDAFASAIAFAASKENYQSFKIGRTGIVPIGDENLLTGEFEFKREGKRVAKFTQEQLLGGAWRQVIKSTPVIFGHDAFKLYDTYGFPLDLTELMARERGLTVDKDGFEKLMEEQRQRSRAAFTQEVIGLMDIAIETPTKFVGYEKLENSARVLNVLDIKGRSAAVFDESAFYAEMGGQVGDTGKIQVRGQDIDVFATRKVGDSFVHYIGEIKALSVGAEVKLLVDRARRHAIERHHTVTHLLHWALHEVVSKEASQKGSFVGPDKLTFDFNSPALTAEQVSDVEKLVNERILENAGVSWTEVPHADVKNRKDVMQFFGDKYGDIVRVVQIGGHAGKLDGYSMELCGGTHTRATGEIGLFRIIGESAVAAGVRRIEAVAGLQAYQKTKHEAELIGAVAGKVNSPVGELEKKIDALLAHQKQLEKSLQAAKQKEAAGDAKVLLAKAETINGIPAIITNVANADGDTLQTIADALKSQFKGVIVLGGAVNGAVSLVAAVSPEFTAKVQAGKIIQGIAPIVGGKGGGKPDNARGGGKDVAKLDEALAKAKSLLG